MNGEQSTEHFDNALKEYFGALVSGIDAKVSSMEAGGSKGSAERPTQRYDREAMYGKTPTKADRQAVGAKKGEVADHDPPLVKRYYEGDPSRGEKPGYKMTDAERRASAKDRSRMKPQPASESNSQGGKMSKYSKDMAEKWGL